MGKPKKLLLGAGAMIAVLAIAVAVFFVTRADAPDALVIGDRATDETADQADQADESGDEAPQVTLTDATGSWILTGDSVAGYRVVEDFVGGIADFEAVGRSSEITGSLEIDRTTLAAAQFSIDVASIEGADRMRNESFRGPIMNAAMYPTAEFVLAAPIDLGDDPTSGELLTVDVTGQLTMRGVTNDVTFPLDATLVGDEVQVAGSIEVVFADYGIENPSNVFVEVRDEGLVEFSLFFEMN